MKVLLIVLVILFFQTACFPSASNTSGSSGQTTATTTLIGDQVSTATLQLDGLYRGGFDQATDLQWLFHQGNVLGYNDTHGFVGSADFNTASEQMTAMLMRYPLTLNDEASKQKVSGGSPLMMLLNGIRFTQQVEKDSLVGDYQANTTNGSFLIQDNQLIAFPGRLQAIVGQWQAGNHQLYVTMAGGLLQFKGINPVLAGCNYDGRMNLLTTDKALYQLQLEQRRNCEGFNHSEVAGYALLDNSGVLYWFLYQGSEMLFSQYQRVESSSDSTTTETTTDNSSDTSTDESASETTETETTTTDG